MFVAPPPEEWRPVVGYEGYYEVSSWGRVRSLDRVVPDKRGRTRRLKGRVLCLKPDNRRSVPYWAVNLRRDGGRATRDVHVLILESFVGPRPEGLVARHLDGNSLHNAVWNLQYSTQRENLSDREEHGTLLRGEDCSYAKLTTAQVRSIREDLRLHRVIAEEYGVGRQLIGDIKNRRRWAHVQ